MWQSYSQVYPTPPWNSIISTVVSSKASQAAEAHAAAMAELSSEQAVMLESLQSELAASQAELETVKQGSAFATEQSEALQAEIAERRGMLQLCMTSAQADPS